MTVKIGKYTVDIKAKDGAAHERMNKSDTLKFLYYIAQYIAVAAEEYDREGFTRTAQEAHEMFCDICEIPGFFH